MKNIVLGCMILFITIGCAKITYKDNEFRYSRIGSQALNGLTITKLPDGTVEVKVEKQKADSGKLGKIIADTGKLVVETGKLIAAGGVGGAIVK